METSIVKEGESQLKFPLVAKSKKTGCIFLFNNEHTGIVIHVAEGDEFCWAVGDVSDSLSPVYFQNVWEILPSVTIEFKS